MALLGEAEEIPADGHGEEADPGDGAQRPSSVSGQMATKPERPSGPFKACGGVVSHSSEPTTKPKETNRDHDAQMCTGAVAM